MLTNAMETILNQQIEKEGYSSNLYLAMAVWAESNGFNGISKWLYAQSEEERLHMLKFIHFVGEREGTAIIPEFKKPPVDYGNVKNLFDEVFKHEKYISASINDIVGKSLDERDYTTHTWIQWFVNEQIEEEASVKEILDKLTLVGDKNMYMFDRDILGMRVAAGE
ncbi:MAG: ferritin [Bacteroidales bacterium]|nr:ferritin [Bacteroidales bacterium]MCF8389531.1 ferritin [Bacteroidales bacterium]